MADNDYSPRTYLIEDYLLDLNKVLAVRKYDLARNGKSGFLVILGTDCKMEFAAFSRDADVTYTKFVAAWKNEPLDDGGLDG